MTEAVLTCRHHLHRPGISLPADRRRRRQGVQEGECPPASACHWPVPTCQRARLPAAAASGLPPPIKQPKHEPLCAAALRACRSGAPSPARAATAGWWRRLARTSLWVSWWPRAPPWQARALRAQVRQHTAACCCPRCLPAASRPGLTAHQPARSTPQLTPLPPCSPACRPAQPGRPVRGVCAPRRAAGARRGPRVHAGGRRRALPVRWVPQCGWAPGGRGGFKQATVCFPAPPCSITAAVMQSPPAPLQYNPHCSLPAGPHPCLWLCRHP